MYYSMSMLLPHQLWLREKGQNYRTETGKKTSVDFYISEETVRISVDLKPSLM